MIAVAGSANAAGAPTATAASLERGYHAMYNLDFPAAQAEFNAWQQQSPADPLGPVSEAAGLLFSELDRLGVLETQLFSDDSRFESRKKLAPDSATREKFQAALGRAETAASARLSKNPNDLDALFAMAMASGLRADYTALIDKRNMASLGYTKDANAWAAKLLKQSPQYYDAYLATGLSKYIVGSLIAPVRWLLHFGGYDGDKKQGIAELQLTADHGHYLAPFARLLLAVSYLREKDRPHAREILAGLRDEFPGNPLFPREIARLDEQQRR